MQETTRIKLLKIALIIIGLAFLFGLYPLTLFWPTGWAWHSEGISFYLQMIIGVYATLGIFLILASRNPLQNLSLIWFTVWSSVVHATIMAVQSVVYPEHMGHLLGDVPALYLFALILAVLTPKAQKI